MRETRLIMGMPITVEIVDGTSDALNTVFDFFTEVDERFSTYKPHSEISLINRGEIRKADYSEEVKEIFTLAEQTRKDTNGFFSITRPDATIDPSGLVKGWAIRKAALLVGEMGFKNYVIDAGGDIQPRGVGADGAPWTVGIRSPFNEKEIIKVVRPGDRGVATSGTYIRGEHIYNPHQPEVPIQDIVSLTVIGPDVYEADRYATAAFAMGKSGIIFIENREGLEGYQIDGNGMATMTTGFEKFVI